VSVDSSLPQLEPFVLDRSSLDYRCFSWLVPKSQIQVPVISFIGVLGSIASIEEDVRFIRWRNEEIASLIQGNGMILDLKEVEFETPVELDVIPSQLRTEQKLVRLVVQAQSRSFISSSFLQNEISTDYERIFSDLAFELKSSRFDQGRNMAERPNVSSPRLIPVSLTISSLLFECYTWHSRIDSSIAGYVIFRGQYRRGSAGYEDALFIKWRLNQFCDLLEPSQLIVDLRTLDYEWGDDLSLYPFRFLSSKSPIRFLLRPEQVSFYTSTIYPANICVNEETAFYSLRE
jgi:hypothetical protein